MFASILLHFIVAEQLPISRRRSAANTFKMTYIFLDEVEEVPSFEKVVDSLYIRDYVDVYITGSNAYMLSSELATLLSGKYTEIKIE